ncbi:MAG: DegT/DnrJ/EryC1/StrS family aminotransferase, partial [Anaerolineae bacterium]|nr:DegT/DnrJ/EryC1/StrS family aminotransferase [Anaerolineae bacterium]
FERELAAYCQMPHAVGLASGTDALLLALVALGAGDGDEVITTPFTFVASANTILHAGAKPVFVDIDPRTFNINPALIEAAITPRTKAIMPVHLYGQMADMPAICEIAQKHNLKVIEDSAQAIGASFAWQPVGDYGDIATLSFFPTKNLGAYGDGGAIITRDAALAKQVDLLRKHGATRKYYHEILGYNSRLDALQAHILGVKLRHLADWTQARRAVAARYDALFAGTEITPPYVNALAHHVYHQYTIRVPERRDELISYLAKSGVQAMVYYPVPLPRQPLFSGDMGAYPITDAACHSVLSLPCFPELTSDEQGHIVELVLGFYR